MEGRSGGENAQGLKSIRSFVMNGSNRGAILDLFTFLLNVVVMTSLSGVVPSLIRRASADDPAAGKILFGMALALFVLAPLGATLSRWHFHERRAKNAPELLEDGGGCLFNPIFYFCLTAVIFASVNAYLLQTTYGKREPDGDVFVTSILLGIVLMVVHTWLVYRYFSRPKKPPKSAFLKGPASKFLGDACLFANMALFQSIWGLGGSFKVPMPGSFAEFIGRLFVLLFLALLLYFPPRMFYLAEDIGKRRTWLMILFANSPLLARVLFGWG